MPPSFDPSKPMDNWNNRWQKWQLLKDKAHGMGIMVPGLWCQWRPNESGTTIEWDGGEKFYEYVAWIEYLITHFLGPWGYKLEGEVYWDGEESGDQGLIEIRDNVVKVKHAVITYR